MSSFELTYFDPDNRLVNRVERTKKDCSGEPELSSQKKSIVLP